MASNISVVINTFNEEKNIEQAIKSADWVDEIIVCDMYSEDKTVVLAKRMGAKILFHKKENFVEPARNYAISKASNDWVFILDADERIPEDLAKRLNMIVSQMEQIDYVRIPRKNIIFGKWMEAAMWWPDYNIRFFKKTKVHWTNQIHRPPEALGQGLDLPAEEKYAIVHHNYETVSQFLRRMDRYTTVQAEELHKESYEFSWKDLFSKPLNEFLSRFFANSGHKDGLHGLALSFLQAFSFIIVYLKLWEKNQFKQENINLEELKVQNNISAKEIDYWIKKTNNPGGFLKLFFKK